jgi:hypothetical protein
LRWACAGIAEWSCDIAMTIPQTIPANTITTAAGKLNDDAFIFTSGHELAGLRRPYFECTVLCN